MGRTVKTNLYAPAGRIPKDLLWQKRVYKKDDTKEYRNFCRLLNNLLYSGKGKKGYHHSPGLRGGLSRQQNCIVKVRTGKEEAAHRRFILEYLPQHNKSGILDKPELFSGENHNEKWVDEYLSNLNGNHFKFIISPENNRVDCTALVKTLLKRMEKVSGYSFYWMAAVHTDTKHPHAHVLINGKDRSGKDIWFDKLFLTQTLREMTRQICTEMIGKRSPEEVKASILQSYLSNRFCPYDEALRTREEKLDDSSGTGSLYQSRVRTTDEVLHKRLMHLEEIGLAKREKGKNYSWLLEKDWVGKLQAIGRYNSFLTARRELASSLASQMELFTHETGTVRGIVTRLYKMNDEDSWNNALVVENPALGKAWYIPLYYTPDDSLLKTEISCNPKINQKGLLVPDLKVLSRHEHDRNKR